MTVTVIVCGDGDREATIRNLILDGDNNRQFDTVITSDVDVARQAMLHPKLKKFSKEVEVVGYKTPMPPPPPPGKNAVVVPHELAQPSRVAAALASDDRVACQSIFDALGAGELAELGQRQRRLAVRVEAADRAERWMAVERD